MHTSSTSCSLASALSIKHSSSLLSTYCSCQSTAAVKELLSSADADRVDAASPIRNHHLSKQCPQLITSTNAEKWPAKRCKGCLGAWRASRVRTPSVQAVP
eukprot:scpid70744/ scgid27259/ 